MLKSNLQNYDYEFEQNQYVPNKNIKRLNIVNKIKIFRILLFWAPILQIIGSILFLILLIINSFIGKKIGFEFSRIQLSLLLSYVGIETLVNIIFFMIPAKKIKKKSSFRITAISTLILSTLILSGSLFFWAIPVLLFFSFISLFVWICELIASIILIFVVEELPNEK